MEVVTFYSYKGGVGRTLLLAWVARALAARGKRVLALDLDLEAPGLSTKLRPKSEPRPGFGVVDLLLRFQGGASPPTDLAQWCLPVETERGGLWLLTAGAAPSPAYWHALSRISWETLFVERAADGARFFLWLRDALAKAVDADFLLIDARTGVTEMGAAAVGMLADTVVAVTNTSDESKNGLREVLRAAVGSPRSEGRRPLRVLPVLSRIPALLGADDDARLVDRLQGFLNKEADPLTSTLAVERVLAIHHEEALLEDEQRAFLGPRLRVIADYERVLAWLMREPMPGPDVNLSLPRSSQFVEVVRAQQEVIAAYRESAAVNPVIYTPMLADALASIARNFAQLGRREDALAAAEEMVGLYRGLARHRPDIHMSNLANSLRVLGSIQSELGRREEALRATQEAVEVCRGLVEQEPHMFRPDLASALNNLGVRLSELGMREDALGATQEAVEVYRGLAKRWPDVFMSDLASTLNNLGIGLSALGRQEEALRAMQEAVEVYRRLVEQRPDAFLPEFASTLSNLGGRLRDLGKREEALRVAQEAVDIRRGLAEQWADGFLPELARELNNLGVGLSDLGKREEALRATQEAVDIRRGLAEQRPDAFLPELAKALNNLGSRLSDLGRGEEALPVAQEAVDILRGFAEQRPDAFLPDLARALGALGSVHITVERPVDAMDAFSEGLQIIQPMAVRLPLAFDKMLVELARQLRQAAQQANLPIPEDLAPLLDQLPTNDE